MATKTKVLYTIDNENVSFLRKYSKIMNLSMSSFVNDLITEIRLNSDALLGNYLIDENITNADRFGVLVKSINMLNEQQNEVLELMKGLKQHEQSMAEIKQ